MEDRTLVLIFFVYGYLFWLVFTPIAFLSFELLYDEVVYPAWLSYSVDCHPQGFEQGSLELEEKGFFVAGTFNSVTDEIKIYKPHEDYVVDDETIKHEVCHLELKEIGFNPSCKYGLLVFANEMVCYFRQNYMDYVNVSDY